MRVDNPPRVLIAGGAGGVGLACAEAFAACGAELILVDCDGAALNRAAKRLDAFSRYCDGIGSCSIKALVEELSVLVPSIDVLINGAGRGYVRTLAMAQMTRALLPLLRRGTGQRLVINIPPTGGAVHADGYFPYASSREAFEGLSAMLSEQTRGSGIEVVNVLPKMLPMRPSKAALANPSYRLQRVDLREAAERIVELTALARPDWQTPPGCARRA